MSQKSFNDRFQSLKRSATRRGKDIEIDVTIVEGLMKETHCAYTGHKFTKSNKMSFERVDSRHGYVPGNVIAVITHANHAKDDMDIDQMLADGNICDRQLAEIAVGIETAYHRAAGMNQTLNEISGAMNNNPELAKELLKKLRKDTNATKTYLESAGAANGLALTNLRRAKLVLQTANAHLFTNLHRKAWAHAKKKPLKERLRSRVIDLLLLLCDNRFFKRYISTHSNKV